MESSAALVSPASRLSEPYFIAYIMYARVGSDRDIDVNVRVLAATNKDIPREISRGEFREDLFHRLSVIIIRVPTLAERIDDIPILVDHFLETICGEYNVPVKKIEAEALAELQKLPWTGNIRAPQRGGAPRHPVREYDNGR